MTNAGSLPREHFQMANVDNASFMIDLLPPYTEDFSLPSIVQSACLEAFFVNIRLLCEFLQLKGKRDKDFMATSMVPSWKPKDGDLGGKLDRWWEIASQHVVHFGLPRLDSDLDGSPRLTMSTLIEMRDDVLAVYIEFRTAYQARLPDGHPDKHLGKAPPGGRGQPPRAEAIERLGGSGQ